MNTSAPTSQPPPTLHGNYVLLRAGGLRLLLPQHEVGALEYLASVPIPADIPGLFRLTDADDMQDRRFIAVSPQMKLLTSFPKERFVYTTLGDEEHDLLGWCWDEVRILPELEITPQALPAVLRAPQTPVSRFAEHGDEFLFLCSARQLRNYALGLAEASHG